MNYDISESVSQRSSGEETAENRGIHEIADELRRRCQLYETQLRDSQGDVNYLDVEYPPYQEPLMMAAEPIE